MRRKVAATPVIIVVQPIIFSHYWYPFAQIEGSVKRRPKFPNQSTAIGWNVEDEQPTARCKPGGHAPSVRYVDAILPLLKYFIITQIVIW